MKIEMRLKNETKNCYRFERRNGTDLMTLYLKKSLVDEAGIKPQNGVIITVEEGSNHEKV